MTESAALQMKSTNLVIFSLAVHKKGRALFYRIRSHTHTHTPAPLMSSNKVIIIIRMK